MSVKTFNYSRLEKRRIQLLTLRSSKNEDDCIDFELHRYEHDQAPPYEALSYYGADCKATPAIATQGLLISIPERLYIALHRLRCRHTDRTLWIDVICNYPIDEDEYRADVPQMADIYAKAKSVVIYLGEGTEDTDQLMDYMVQIEQGASANLLEMPGPYQVKEQRMLEDLSIDIMRGPWCSKAWANHQYFYGENAIVRCGPKAVSSRAFLDISRLWLSNSRYLAREACMAAEVPLSGISGRSASETLDHYKLLQQSTWSKATDTLGQADGVAQVLDKKDGVHTSNDDGLRKGIVRKLLMSTKALFSAAISDDLQETTTAQTSSPSDPDDPLSMTHRHPREAIEAGIDALHISKDSFHTRVYESLSRWLTWIENPKPGLQRVQYTCACGEIMFVDVRELRPGGVQSFKNELVTSVTGTWRQALLIGSGARSGGLPTSPPRAYFTIGSGPSSTALLPFQGQIGFPGPSGGMTDESDLQRMQNEMADNTPRYLLLCVNTRNLTKLLHVDLSDIQSDELLFDGIRREYWQSRRYDSWHYGLLMPQWMEERMPVAFRDWLMNIHLRVPQTAELIEFRLVPFPTNICPDKVRLGIPPVNQVKVEKNYHYYPCPTDVEVLSIPKFSHLLKPGHHRYDFWLKTFPKKLREQLTYRPAVIGWGLIIHEGWDWVVLLSNMLILMILIGVGVALYAIFTHDPASAFSFGAYALAVITLLCTMRYWAWQAHESS